MRLASAFSLFAVVLLLTFPLSAAIPAAERDALIDLYNSTGGEEWSDNSGWLGPIGTECDWAFVVCDETNSTVTELQLSDNNLVGELPDSIEDLEELENLGLGYNALSGTIPDSIANLSELWGLDLEYNDFGGNIPVWIAGMSNLEALVIGGNEFEGTFASEFANLDNLYYLQLGPNNLTVDFESLIEIVSEMDVLDSLGLEGLFLKGQIPAEIANIPNLAWLSLGENELSGSVSEALATCATLPFLEGLALNNNFLEGELPGDWSGFPNLEYLALWGNRIAGTIPAGIGTMTKLVSLELDENQLTGSIPPEIGNLTELTTIWLAGNRLTGPIPTELANLTKLENLVLYDNQLTGPVPTFLSGLEDLTWMSLYANRLYGPIPSAIGDFKQLMWLDLEANQLSGTLPPEIGELTSLKEAWLGSNLFEGKIPDAIGNLVNLDYLALGLNNLRGEVPRSVLNLQNAQIIDFSDNALRATDPEVEAFLRAKSWDSEEPFEAMQTLPPDGIYVDEVSPFTITIEWTPILYDWEAGGYQVLVATTPGGQYTPVVTTATKWDWGAVLTNLQPSTTYYFIVQTVTYPHGEEGYFQLNTVFSDPSAEFSATTLDASSATAEVIVTAYPGEIIQAPNVGGGTASYTLTNVGGAATSITLTQDGDFFEQSPTAFVLEPGASQKVALTGKPVSEGEYDGESFPNGAGVWEGLSVYLYLISTPIESVDFVINAVQSRLDLIAPEGQNPAGTLTFRNVGTGNFTGVASSDVQFLKPQQGLITIPAGGSMDVSVMSDRSKRPDADLLIGTQVGRVSLVGISGFGKNGRRDTFDGAPSASLVTVADTVKPPTEGSTIPPIAGGEVALYMTSVGHVAESGGEQVSDISILNTYGTGPANDLQLYYTPETVNAATQVANLKALGSSQAIGLADVVKSVFNGTAEVGTIQIRSKQTTSLSASAHISNSSNPQGNFGTSVPVFRSDRSAVMNEELFITGLRKDDTGHTDLYLQETRGSETTVRVDYFSADGKITGSTTETIGAFKMKSLIDTLLAGTCSVRVTTTDGGGAISAYAAPVDQMSKDTWAVTDWSKQLGYESAEPVVIPVGGSVRGRNNTFFKTDVAITNRCASVAQQNRSGSGSGSANRSNCREEMGKGTLRYYQNTGGVLAKEIEVGLLQTSEMKDVVRTVFGIQNDTVGHLTFTPTAGEFAVTSRTYTIVEGSTATFGSTVPAIGMSKSVRPGQSRRIGALGDSTRATTDARTPATSRTNFGMVEVEGQPATVRVSVYHNDPRSLASGKPLGSKVYELAANQFVSQSNLVEAVIGPDRERLYGDLSGVQVQFDVISQTGSIVVYTSSVDNGTGDSILRTE